MKQRNIHIAILTHNLPGERNRRIVRQCLALEAHGYHVTVISPRVRPALRVMPGTRDTRLRSYPIPVLGSGLFTYAIEFSWSFLCVAILLFGEVLRGRAQGVQVCNPSDVYWPLAILIRATGRRWVFDHQDLCPEIYATRAGGRPNRWVYRLLQVFERLTLRTADEVVTPNRSFRDNARRHGVREDRVTIVGNGPAQAEVAGTPSNPAGEHVIAYVGVVGPQDNVEGAVLAVAELVRLRGRAGWRMVIAGDGESMPAVQKLSAEQGVADMVHFAGWLSGNQLDELLWSATVAIQPDLPTRMNQLSSMAKTADYLAHGLPIVAADLVETRCAADDAASYVPTGGPDEFAHALHTLLADPQRRARMRVVGLDRFRNALAWEHQVGRYLALWQRLLDGSAVTPIPSTPNCDPCPDPGDDITDTPRTDLVAGVVIPAHNEATVIGRCLDALRDGASDDALDITVVANGCTDATAWIARARPGVRVLELPKASKSAALNAGDAVSAAFPRIYLDADIVLEPAAARALAAALTGPGAPLAVVPRRDLDVAGRSPLVRAFYAIDRHLPAYRSGLFGRGVVAVSAAGRARFERFPDVLADDLFLDGQFHAAEKAVVEAVGARVATPRHSRELLRCLTRIRAANAQLRAADPTIRRAARLAWLRDVVLHRPWLAPASVVYVTFAVRAALAARRAEPTWQRDTSTRTLSTCCPRRGG
ncbi:glycosyltransferase [Dactylosporangium sp. NPDC005572]|uniref:glycosyltransferase n=1 Tax=Dactylosporangium sp. NPDC005572 TaxID=3156889 RepID=UPI0033A05CFE